MKIVKLMFFKILSPVTLQPIPTPNTSNLKKTVDTFFFHRALILLPRHAWQRLSSSHQLWQALHAPELTRLSRVQHGQAPLTLHPQATCTARRVAFWAFRTGSLCEVLLLLEMGSGLSQVSNCSRLEIILKSEFRALYTKTCWEKK